MKALLGAMAASTPMEVDSPLAAVERSIQNVEEQIKAVEDQLKNEQDPDEKKYLRKKEEQLREEKLQLRKKEEQLREEKLLLLKSTVPTGVLTIGSGSASGTVTFASGGLSYSFHLFSGKVKVSDVLVAFDASAILIKEDGGKHTFLSADRDGLSIATFQHGATVEIIIAPEGAGLRELGKQMQEVLERTEVLERLRLYSPGSFTVALKDEVLGAEIMGRSDFNYVMEHKIIERFSRVDVRRQLNDFTQRLRPWKELAVKALAQTGKRKAEPSDSGESNKKLKAEAEKMPDEEKTLQLGISYILQSFQGTECFFHDTSAGGMTGSNDKPDCLYSIVKHLVTWLTAVLAGELKWDLENSTDRKKCIGQVVARLRKMIATQKGRKLAFGFIADRCIIQFVGLDASSNNETMWWSRELPFEAGATDPAGFILLLKMIYADKAAHGYAPSVILEDLAFKDGRLVQDIKLFQFKGEAISCNDRGCYMHSGVLDGQDVVVKVCPSLQTELKTLRMLQGTPGILPVLGDGSLPDGRQYMVIPMCKPLKPHFPEYRLLLLQMAESIKLLSDRNTFHADISVGNIVRDDCRYYLIDFGSAVTYATTDDDDQRTGCTPTFAAIQVQEGDRHCLSSELESLMYVVVYLAMDGKVPWSHAKDMAVFKRAVFSDAKAFSKKVLAGVEHPALQEQLLTLRNLFIEPNYQTGVTYEAFCHAVK